MNDKFIKLESKPHRLDIIINNPPVNILTGDVMVEMIEALKDAARNKDYRVVVLKGEGKAWSAGADVSEHLPDKFRDMLNVFSRLCELIREYPLPIIAAVNGMCLGGGCEVAAMCDFIIASEKAKFGQPEIKVGVLPPAAASHFADKYGLATALEIILTGDVFDAETSQRMGLVTKLVSVDAFEEEVDKFTARLTGNSREVLRLAKLATLKGFELDPREAIKKVDEIYRNRLMSTHDAVEGLTAFTEKRKPEWKDE
ncbi:MAG: enoyl-CoA hydratase/isomerase family protein [Candidatus Hatepunaea meridiana]|nr:enoyl-CoA hydratase/isomerase family protein [Candidatus Hatepunaea meridiana]